MNSISLGQPLVLVTVRIWRYLIVMRLVMMMLVLNMLLLVVMTLLVYIVYIYKDSDHGVILMVMYM